MCDLAEVHLARRDQAANLNLQMWEIIGINHSEKMVKSKERINDNLVEDNFLQDVSQNLLPLIMKCLLILNKNEEDNDELRLSASRTLEAFAKVCNINVIETITSSVSSILQSSDPYHQQASVSLFSTICEYPDRQYVEDVFRNGFDHLFNLLQSQNQTVVRNSLIGFIRLSEMLPPIFLTHPNIADIVDIIMGYVKVPLHEIRYFAIQILANISEGLKDNPSPVCDNPMILLTKIVQYYSETMEIMHT